MAKKLTKKDLIAAYNELDKVVGGIEPSIEYDDLSFDEFGKELYSTYEQVVEEGDSFTEATENVFTALSKIYKEEEPEVEEEETEEEPKGVEIDDEENAEEEIDDEVEEIPVLKKETKKMEKENSVKNKKKDEVKQEDEDPLIAEVMNIDNRDELVILVYENKDTFGNFPTKDFTSFNRLKFAVLKFLGVEEKGKRIINNPCLLPRGVGVLKEIKSILEKAGKNGISRDEIIKKLSKKFPDRPADGMKKTVFAQVPGQLVKHGFPIAKNKSGLFYIEQ